MRPVAIGSRADAGLVHEDHLGVHREAPGDAEPLLLTAAQLYPRLEPVLHLVPEGRLAQRALDDLVHRRPALASPAPFGP